MESLWNFITQNLNYILIAIVAIVSFLAGLNKSISGAIVSVWNVIISIITFFANALREPDGNSGGTGKTSISRIILVYVVIEIVAMAWVALTNLQAKIPTEMMTLFWISGGLYMLIKVYNAASPQLQSIIDALMVKWNGVVPTKRDEPPITKIETTQESKVQ
jgi:prolipoprotein diacylglyceryltransferase